MSVTSATTTSAVATGAAASNRHAVTRTTWWHLAMIVAALVWLLPMLWMLSLALSDNATLAQGVTGLIPRDFTLDNIFGVFSVGLTSRWFLNSAIVAVVTTVLTVLLCAMAGYAFARIRFPGRTIVYATVLAGLMIPKEAMFIPLFTMVADVQMHNTYAALVLPRIAAPLGVFLMTQFFSRIPLEIEEAARVDGAGPWRTFFSIMLPLATPGMVALGIFTFVQTWNDYLWPLVSATKSEMFTITTGLASLQGNFAQATELGSLMARGLVGSLPLLIIFLLFQRHLIRGISMTSGGK
ncbi:carbohydrate ABC transporter permease [Mycetocola sp.]|uniref:carbohydrate ABC transporter permease n=1 Tax=Mycetocola sp. TaxID=1871042 RepID=UPI00398948A3